MIALLGRFSARAILQLFVLKQVLTRQPQSKVPLDAYLGLRQFVYRTL